MPAIIDVCSIERLARVCGVPGVGTAASATTRASTLRSAWCWGGEGAAWLGRSAALGREGMIAREGMIVRGAGCRGRSG
eukprot:COSAG02_NODE_10148_length_2010_cov_2.440607_1_plen_79_part_00